MIKVLFPAFLTLAALEIATLAVLVLNLATIHDAVIARIIGPIHGVIYLTVALIALLSPGLTWTTRLSGVVPVVGGVRRHGGCEHAPNGTGRRDRVRPEYKYLTVTELHHVAVLHYVVLALDAGLAVGARLSDRSGRH